MKLIKIFGMVFALHVALICLVLLINGCRSATTAPSNNGPTPAATAGPEENPNWSSQAAAMDAPVVQDPYYPTSTSTPGAPLTGPSPAERARTEPTRPLNPNEYISVGATNTAEAPPPPEPATYVVRSGDSFWRIAKANNTTIAELQRLNPGVKPDALRPGTTIKVPGTAPASSTLPAVSLGGGGTPTTTTSNAATSTYVVRPGDSLSKIAARNGTTVAALREANKLRSDVIHVGESLVIPGGATQPASQPAPASYEITPLTPPGEAANEVTFVVQRGDTLGEIARKYDVTVSDLMAANHITDPRKVRIGQKLVIPGFRAVGTGAIPRPAPTATTSTTPPPAATNQPLLPPPGSAPATTTPANPPANSRPPELDAPPAGVDAPPVLPLDSPVAAP